MAVRDDFSPGEVLTSSDLNDTFASKLPYSYGTATPSTTDSGFLWYDSNSTPPEVKFWDGAAFQALTSGKILQVVRATDSTDRSTTSASLVDASISVTITPTKSTSAIIVLSSSRVEISGGGSFCFAHMAITDSSNNIISGGGESQLGSTVTNQWNSNIIHVAYDTPATTSATTYKLRFRRGSSTSITISNANSTGQLYAIEVSA